MALFNSPKGRRGQKVERSEIFCDSHFRQGRRSQKEIVEFTLLSASAFLILTLVSITFANISSGLQDSEIRADLSTLASETALAVARAENIIQESGGLSNFTIFLDFPQQVAGKDYELDFSQSTDLGCKLSRLDSSGSCIRAVSRGIIIFYPVKVSRPIEGSVTGSATQRPAVTYNSNEGFLRLGLV